MTVLRLAFALGLTCGAFVAMASERTIIQKGRAFSDNDVTIKRGDTLLFVNNDTVVHNVTSDSAGNEFDLGSQAPGISTPVTFNADGLVTVICAIHPRMRMTVRVTR